MTSNDSLACESLESVRAADAEHARRLKGSAATPSHAVSQPEEDGSRASVEQSSAKDRQSQDKDSKAFR